MGRYPDSFLEQVKNKIDIVDLISSFTSVSRKGRDYWACCPFHHEKTPSFQIRSDYQYYRCYGCGKHGNIFQFIMDYENVPFGEAVEILAKRAGLEVPEPTFDPKEKARKDLLEKIYNINRETARFYYDNLFKDEGQPAREYFAARGLSSKTVNIFGMGYSSDFNSLPAFLRSKGYDDKSMVEAGVAFINQRGEASDFFGGRVIIPIIGGNGKVLGFTGRVLEAKPDFAKYKNTSTTLAFNKRKNLFGVNLFKKYRQSGVRAMILVEGHMDVISLYQAGIQNVVASMGTSLTVEQCREIKRYADLVYVSYDGDSAGQHATLRGLDLLKNEGLDVKVVCLTDNLDPDDYVRKFGKDGYLKLLDEAIPLIDYKLKKVEENFDLGNADERIKYARSAISVLNELDSVEKEIYAETVGKKSGLSAAVVLEQTKEAENSAPTIERKPKYEDTETVNNPVVAAQRYILSAFIHGKSYITSDRLVELKECLLEEIYNNVFEHYVKIIADGKQPKAADITELVTEENEKEIWLIADAVDAVSSSEQAAYYDNCIKKIKLYRKNKELERLTAELLRETDNSQREKIKIQIKKLKNV